MKKINGLFHDKFINERLNQLDQLTRLIEEFLALPLENRVWPMLRGRRLILMTDDPHLATQARFMGKPLCNHINNKLQLKISGVDIKLMTLPLARFERNLSRKKISPQTAEILKSIAESIEDKELQEGLQRIADSST